MMARDWQTAHQLAGEIVDLLAKHDIVNPDVNLWDEVEAIANLIYCRQGLTFDNHNQRWHKENE
jgi:hypothetical protein